MSRFGKYCDWYKCENGTIELPIMQGINSKSVTDLFENEKELCVVEWGDEIPLLMTENEVFDILNKNKIYNYVEIVNNCIEITFNGDIIYIICPLNAIKKTKESFKTIKELFRIEGE